VEKTSIKTHKKSRFVGDLEWMPSAGVSGRPQDEIVKDRGQ
jgi:hypothetical protein